MPEQLQLGEALRDEGIGRVWSNAGEWRTVAVAAVEQLASAGGTFTAEDVRAIAGDPPHPNAFGALLATCARRGLITKVGFTKAKRPSLHASDLAVWKGAA